MNESQIVTMLTSAFEPVSLEVANDHELLKETEVDEEMQDAKFKLPQNELDKACYASQRYSLARRSTSCGLVQVALGLRFRRCLQRISTHEKVTAGQRYAWIVRCRPDVYLSCLLYPPVPSLLAAASDHHSYVIYAWDLLALMPREAAEIHMRQITLGPVSPLCTTANYLRQREFCNACLVERLGLAALRFANSSSFEVVRPCGLEHRAKPCSREVAPPEAENIPSEACVAQPLLPWAPLVKWDEKLLRAGGSISQHRQSTEGLPPWSQLCSSTLALRLLGRNATSSMHE